MTTLKIFDNERVEELVKQYQKSKLDPKILSEIFSECNNLISVIATKYASADILQEDLMQEGRMHVYKSLPEWKSNKKKKLYSFLSVVIRNGMIDYIRKQKPAYELKDVEDETITVDDDEYVAMLAEDLRGWFESRFPSIISKKASGQILQVIIGGMLDSEIGKRQTIKTLVSELNFKPQHAKLLYESVLVKLRTIIEKPKGKAKASEYTLQPELESIVNDDYTKVSDAFSGLAVKFNNKKGKVN